MYQVDTRQHAQSTALHRCRPYTVRVRACAAHLYALCTAVAGCVYRSLRSVIHHLPLFAAALCVTDPRALCTAMHGPFWLYQVYGYLNCLSNSDVWCFLLEAHPRNVGIRQHAKNTNNVTTPPNNSNTSSSGPYHARVADPWCTAIASCYQVYRRLRSVICHHHLSLFCHAEVHSCAVCRARRET